MNPVFLINFSNFLYRYIASVLEDSKSLSSHAKKKLIDAEDVRLAVDLLTRQKLYDTQVLFRLKSKAKPKGYSSGVGSKMSKGLSLNSKYSTSSASAPVFKIQVAPGVQLGNSSSQPSVKLK
ncbi:TAF9 [Lepeophtheirus salmonis]|uniref:TAF9 n=1 Tax=Lepeophtheirus salmonis TaxID=72036 RepID=A0A7R8CPX9_LEPSM|nr:TAF9 [Lepeophtheirus salmonis]CAF2887411.1 TAF9 [Lepeophtheirus salmonis]